jgi:hypothetical protein
MILPSISINQKSWRYPRFRFVENAGLENTYFGEKSRVYLEDSVPKVKASLSNNLNGMISISI